MKRKFLKEGTDVSVHGKSYRGFPSEVRFSASSRTGWFWQPRGECSALPVAVSLARYYRPFGFLYLRHGFGRALPVWEHIGVLAFTGLTGVVVRSSWHPPHFGRVSEFWEALKPHLVETAADATWCRPERRVSWRYPNRDGYTEFAPHPDPCERSLIVRIVSDYRGIGKLEREFVFPRDVELLLEAFTIYSPAYPATWKWPIAKLAARLGWPHLHKMVWPHLQSNEATIVLYFYHRLVDLLGAFSLASHTHLPSGILTSVRAGLEADLRVLQMARCFPIYGRVAA